MKNSFVGVESLLPRVESLNPLRLASAKMTVGLAEQITGGLSNPSKMPGSAYGFSAEHCLTGSKLVNVAGSVCEGCYALKGFYVMPSYDVSDGNRFESWKRPRWVEAMVFLIGRAALTAGGEPFFRWHDSGDLQSVEHLEAICAVCEQLPGVRFWLPTREYRIVEQYRAQHSLPLNLVIRLSAHMVDREAPSGYGLPTSTVHSSEENEPAGHVCRAYQTPKLDADGEPLRNKKGKIMTGYCGECRACWDGNVANVSYLKH